MINEHIPDEVKNSQILNIRIKCADKYIELDMLADLDINYDNIRHELENTPSTLAYWAALFSELKMNVGVIERKIKVLRAKIVDQMVKEAAQGQVRLTDKQVQFMLEDNEELIKLENQLLVANKNCGKLYYVVEALKMKSDNLRSLAGFARIEMGNS